MSQPEPPKIEFPCVNYPIKVIGLCEHDYLDVVLEIVRKHAPECSDTNIKEKESSKGSFRSVTLYITATGVEQLECIHKELMSHEYIRMVI